ncbi:MAG TPA: energy transducer TonB [Pyrinomonadaceae bacterium]|nr:energy transducer TonB [Pyrinomonadaceae bacterium]
MLDQLVESKSNSRENTRRSEFLIGTLFIMVSALIGAWTYSLFAKDYAMGGSDLELSTLVAPVPVPEEEPPPPPEKQPEQKQKVEPNVDIRKELIQNIMQSPKEPTKIETAKQNIPAMRLNTKTVQGDRNVTSSSAMRDDDRGTVDLGNGGLAKNTTGEPGGTGTAPPPPPPPPTPKPTPKEEPKGPPKTISGGVVNGKATSLPKPPYPAAARAVRASGSVSVQVLIDETGRVVSASAASGHPLLQQAAVAAARQARFSPTILSGQPVKVSGIITYNFVP